MTSSAGGGWDGGKTGKKKDLQRDGEFARESARTLVYRYLPPLEGQVTVVLGNH